MLVQIILTDPISLPILSPVYIVDIEKIVGEVISPPMNELASNDFVQVKLAKLWASKQYNMGWLDLNGSAVQITLRINKKLIASFSDFA